MASLRNKLDLTLIAALALVLSAGWGHAQAGPIKKVLDKAGEMKTEGAKHAAEVEKAQDPATKPAVQPATKPAVQPAAKPSPTSPMQPPAGMKQTAPGKPAAKSTAKPATGKPAQTMAKKPMAKKPAEMQAKKPAAKSQAEPKDKGDPFVVPLKPTVAANEMPMNLPQGQGGLMVAQVELQGLLKTTAGMKAIVRGPNGRTYFLKVNDKVFNGRVSRISDDTLYFEETMVDPLGKVLKREVTKKLPSK